MTLKTRDFYVWCEKYRPQVLDDCVLTDAAETTFREIIARQETVNLLLCGRAGTGKTTVAKVLAHELDADTLVINASDENGIDVLRTKIKDFASSISFSGKRKIVILDEADYLNPQSTQPALRAFIEEFAGTTSFIFTCNHVNRIIAPLHSRCSIVDFKINKADRAAVMQKFYTRVAKILAQEQVTFDKSVLIEVVKLYFPDFRRTLNELQRFGVSGTLSSEILSQITDKDIAELMKALSKCDFNAVRKWMGAHEDIDEAQFYRMLSEQLTKYVKPSDQPAVILSLAEYSYRSAFAADKPLNMLACLVDIMSNLTIKETA